MLIVRGLLVFILLTAVKEVRAASFTVLNNCGYTVWPGFVSTAGVAPLATTGFELLPGTTRVVETPARWSGRVWGRTGCTFGSDGKGKCITGDCGGQLQCDGAGAIPPASLVEITVNSAGLNVYDISPGAIPPASLPEFTVNSAGLDVYDISPGSIPPASLPEFTVNSAGLDVYDISPGAIPPASLPEFTVNSAGLDVYDISPLAIPPASLPEFTVNSAGLDVYDISPDAIPPASLPEFTVNSAGLDVYDISLGAIPPASLPEFTVNSAGLDVYDISPGAIPPTSLPEFTVNSADLDVDDISPGTIPPASLLEFTVNSAGLDVYDISLVDGSYLPLLMVANRGTGAYMTTGCIIDINLNCPKELQLDDGLDSGNDNILACQGACEAFGSPQYCCSEAYASPNTCSSYAFDDKTSTLTCADSGYAVTFCPTVTSKKSLTNTLLATRAVVSAGTSNANRPPQIIIGGSKVSKVVSTTTSSMPTWTSILISLFLIITSTLLTLRI